MTTSHTSTIEAIGGIGVFVALFIVASLVVHHFGPALTGIITRGGMVSMLVYITIIALSIVIAPINDAPFIPLATAVWGVHLAALFSMIGGFIGSCIAFALARRYGTRLAHRVISGKELARIHAYMPTKNIFIATLLMKIALPFDVLSYAIGIFTNLSWKQYIVITFISIIPYSLLFSYLGSVSLAMQLGAAALLLPAAYWYITTQLTRRSAR